MLLLGVNIAVLVLSGARGPLAVTMAIALIALAFVPSPALRARHRLPIALAGAVSLPVLVAAASQLSGFRLFNVLSGEAGGMSGRDLLGRCSGKHGRNNRCWAGDLVRPRW
jgi:hypothetical protein